MKYADGCNTATRCRQSFWFDPLLTWIFGSSALRSSHSSTSLVQFFHINLLPSPLQLQTSARESFSFWRMTDLSCLFSNFPQICSMRMWSRLRGEPVRHSQSSSRFLLSRGVPAIVRRLFILINFSFSVPLSCTSPPSLPRHQGKWEPGWKSCLPFKSENADGSLGLGFWPHWWVQLNWIWTSFLNNYFKRKFRAHVVQQFMSQT